MPNFGLTFVFYILKNHPLSLFAKMALQREKMNAPPQLFKNIFSLLGYIIAYIFISSTGFQEYFEILRIKS